MIHSALQYLKQFFKTITPLSFLTVAGITVCMTEIVIVYFASSDHGELAPAMLLIWATGLYIILLADRFLIKKAGQKKTAIIELIILAVLSLLYYVNN